MMNNKEIRHFDAMAATAPVDSPGVEMEVRSRQEQEEDLILTAWHSMSTALQQHSLCTESRVPGPAQSFLAQQRQSTQVRRHSPCGCSSLGNHL
ncbi:protein Hook homolog 2-like [Sphaeramia orbicularis]|uniref:protein Hook homolog 2-like n=1 Tax=Sphaeramia orbicularis TaxID=375764 RepID=UPI00117F7E8B|nr:protein Hook homolog 2-like [Sphaeramia orbicularis]